MYYIFGETRLISQTQSSATSYYLQDGQGSTRTLTNQLGLATDSYTYDAFGELIASTGATANKYLYTGQQFDTATGLYSLRARHYSPSVGRFLSQDVWPYNFQNPMELNRYTYAMQNPINFADPTGFTAGGEYGGGTIEGTAQSSWVSIIAREIGWQFLQILAGSFAGAAGYGWGLILHNLIYTETILEHFSSDDLKEAIVIGAMIQVANDIAGRIIATLLVDIMATLVATAIAGFVIGLSGFIVDMYYEGNPNNFDNIPQPLGSVMYPYGNALSGIITLLAMNSYFPNTKGSKGATIALLIGVIATIALNTIGNLQQSHK